MATEGTVGVVYLARSADGLDAFHRFANSYRKHPAELNHDLIVIYKGFSQRSDLAVAHDEFSDLPHTDIELDDTGFDIGSYMETCRRVSHERLFFLNTHSEILAAGWLRHVFAHAAREDCGIAGAMGSYESLFDTVGFLEAIIRASLTATGEQARELAFYFDFLLNRFRPDWYGGAPRDRQGDVGWRRLKAALWPSAKSEYPSGGLRGTALIWPGAPEIDTTRFARFPNPHIRSNGFMMRRATFLSSGIGATKSKGDANLFESGREGMTAQLCRAGLSAIVVGADGCGYGVQDWWRSGTFRLGDQANLLIADNHTRAFFGISRGGRVAHERMTWGDYLGPAPLDFPELGFGFHKGSLVL